MNPAPRHLRFFRRAAGWLTGIIGFAPLLAVAGFVVSLPPRPPDAPAGTAFAAAIATLDLAAREQAALAELRRGNVPDFWRRFVDVRIGNVVAPVAPDYLAIGSDEDYFLLPLRPLTAQAAADLLECSLPTRKIVDAIHAAAAVKLTPSPIPPDAAMTTVAVFHAHNAAVREQRRAQLSAQPAGALVAGHKKDVVLTPRLATAEGKVAIYGWHRPDGTAIQPLYLGHADSWVDYSHGVRLIARRVTVDGRPAELAALLADEKTAAWLSDEGSLARPRYVPPARVVAGPGEVVEELNPAPGVRVVILAPAAPDAARPVRLVLYGAPAGNSIEHTFGRRLQAGDDWHFDLQHLAAQARWLRAQDRGSTLVVACLQTEERSWVAWRRKHAAEPARIPAIVEALRARYPGARLVLTGHSAGGTFTLGYLDAVERIPDDVERIAFLDSNYAYDSAKGHDRKLVAWLEASPEHRLCVLAYQDYLALLDGKTFVSEAGGTWGRSRAMLQDLGSRWPFRQVAVDGLQHHTALDGRVQFFLKENPTRAILHTRQVEWNGFIHAMGTGTPAQDRGYVYLGDRAYSDLISAP